MSLGVDGLPQPVEMTGAVQTSTEELTVTTTGIAHTSTNPMNMHSTIEPLGISMGIGGATSDLFKSTDCSGTTCKFATKKNCEGSIEKLASGDVRVVASGSCQDWSGTWSAKH